jgi:CBS domain-containing protein
MLREGMLGAGPQRIGVEQEVFLVGEDWDPAPIAPEVLSSLDAPEFTTELARFNLEVNVPPVSLEGACFSALSQDIDRLLAQLGRAAQMHGGRVLLAGIVPTLGVAHLGLHNLTPCDRFRALNDAMGRMRGGPYRLHIQGADELNMEHDSVMLEAAATSFQVHLQVAPRDFVRTYNMAQALAGPVLAAATNSPVLLGRRLWEETRIALFQQAVDTRRTFSPLRELTGRVRFGEQWVRDSVMELFLEDVVRIPAIVVSGRNDDAAAVLARGGIPTLGALQTFNSTVYRWNRPCYGVTDGQPHLRIECRVLPSGPTVEDEVANAAVWVGAVLGGVEAYPNLTDRLPFEDARANLIAGARRGLDAGFKWIDGRSVSAPRLLLKEILPLARAGLAYAGVAPDDIAQWVGIVEARVAKRATGSNWIRRSLAHMHGVGTARERMAAITAAMAKRQEDGMPVHEWDLATIAEAGGWRRQYGRVGQYMSTDLFTVREHEVVDLAALILDWKRIRQVLVEDEDGRLVGIVPYGAVLRFLRRRTGGVDDLTPVRNLVETPPVVVSPATTTLEAVRAMREHRVRCLPVVDGGHLVGIVSLDDFLPIVERAFMDPTTAGGESNPAARGAEIDATSVRS